MRNLTALILLSLASTCLAEQGKVSVTMEQAIAAAVKADRAKSEIGSFEAEAKLVAGNDLSLSVGWRDVDPQALAKWLASIKDKQIWSVMVCPTRIEPSGKKVRWYCIASWVDAASGKVLEGP